MDQITIIVGLVTLNAALSRALREDVAFFPTLTAPWRGVWVAVLTLVAGPVLDSAVRGVGWKEACVTAGAAALPTVVNLIVSAFSDRGKAAMRGFCAVDAVVVACVLAVLALLGAFVASCGPARAGCAIIKIADYACDTLMVELPDGGTFQVSRAELAMAGERTAAARDAGAE